MTILTAGATGEINNNHRYYHCEHGKEKILEAITKYGTCCSDINIYWFGC